MQTLSVNNKLNAMN